MTLPAAFLNAPLAHRALHDASQGVPENSRTAVARAVRAGYGIEIDIQLTSDGEAVVFHDATLDRLTEAGGPVAARTLRDLGEVGLRNSDERIPSLAEILDLVAGKVPLLVEIKDQSGGMGPGEDRLEQAAARTLAGYAGPVAVMSFNPHVVGAMQRLAPDLPRGLVTSAFLPSQYTRLTPEQCLHLRSIRDFGRVGAAFISHDQADLGSPRVAELKSHGTPILCWTVTTPQMEAEARRVADNITFEGYLPPLPV